MSVTFLSPLELELSVTSLTESLCCLPSLPVIKEAEDWWDLAFLRQGNGRLNMGKREREFGMDSWQEPTDSGNL